MGARKSFTCGGNANGSIQYAVTDTSAPFTLKASPNTAQASGDGRAQTTCGIPEKSTEASITN